MRTRETRPNPHLTGTLNEVDEAWEDWEDEAPAVSPPQLRKRLFKVLAWSGGGFAAVAALSLALFGGLIAAGLGVVGFIAIFAVASQIAHSGAHMLLWTATVFYAVIINLFSASFGVEPLIVAGAIIALLDAGADPLIRDKAGRRALDLLLRKTNFIPEHYEEALRRLEKVTAKAIEAQTTGEGARTG